MICQAPGCPRDVAVKSVSMCDAHYRQLRKGKPLTPILPAPDYGETCSFAGCDGRHFSRGLCGAHYAQRRKGRQLTPILRGDVLDRFWAKVQKGATNTACWRWVGAIGSHGYGNFGANGRTVRAHRFCYELANGPIPGDLPLDHLCRNRWCVNPSHLEPVEQAENIRRGLGPSLAKVQNVDQTFCKHGHPLFGDNLYVQAKTGYRYCRECARRRTREWATRQNS